MISCIVLAGGQARRMQGQDKGLVSFRGRPLIEHVIARIKPQIDQIIISANRNADRYAPYADLVIADQRSDFSGPLAGIASCLPHCQHNLVLVVACDMPNLPIDIGTRLSQAINHHEIAIASCHSRQQLALLLKTSLLDSILATLANHEFRFLNWVNTCDTVVVEYADESTFVNINSLGDLDSVC
jgi:molybdopterin-guanine dinucleotide biosynthesis protein A